LEREEKGVGKFPVVGELIVHSEEGEDNGEDRVG
jgi:hypothetical protein